MTTVKRKRGRGNNGQNSKGKDPIDGKVVVFKKTSSVKKVHKASDPTREKRGEGSGASTLNNNNHVKVKTTKIPTEIRISEIHWRYSSRCAEQMLKTYNKWINTHIPKPWGNYIHEDCSDPLFLKYKTSWFMRQLAYDDDSHPIRSWKGYTLKKINPKLRQFDVVFMSKELLGANIYSCSSILNAQKPNYSKYLELNIKTTNCSKNVVSPFGFENEKEYTLFMRFNLDKFKALGKNKYGDVLNFRDCFLFILLLFCIKKPKGFTPFVLDFARDIKATHVTLKRTAQLKNISYSSFYTVLSQFKHTAYKTELIEKSKQILIKSIGSNDLVMKIAKGDNNTVDFEAKLTSYPFIDSIFLTTNMEDILKNTNLEEVFERLINSVFKGGSNGNLLFPIKDKDIRILEAQRRFLHYCDENLKTDAPAIFIDIMELYGNKKDPKRYEKVVRKALPNGTKAERKNFKAEIDGLTDTCREFLDTNKRWVYRNEFIKVLGG